MKAGIHPEYYQTDMVCACGAVYHTRSTRRDIKIGICAACHPFFTGEQKFVDTAGRVEKFARRYGSTKAACSAADTAATPNGLEFPYSTQTQTLRTTGARYRRASTFFQSPACERNHARARKHQATTGKVGRTRSCAQAIGRQPRTGDVARC